MEIRLGAFCGGPRTFPSEQLDSARQWQPVSV